MGFLRNWRDAWIEPWAEMLFLHSGTVFVPQLHGFTYSVKHYDNLLILMLLNQWIFKGYSSYSIL